MYLDRRKEKFLKDHGLQLIKRTEEEYMREREYWGLPGFHEADWIVCARKGRIEVGNTARWHYEQSERIVIPTCKRAKNNHSFYDSVTKILYDIDKLKRQRAEAQKKKHLREIKEAGNEYAVD